MPTDREADQVELDFPLILSLPELLGNQQRSHSMLQPSQIDKLALEISKVFGRASVPESAVSIGELEINEIMMKCIGKVDQELSLKQDSGRDGAMLMLFRRTMITPETLQALFRMCDANIHTGTVRCSAFWQLDRLLSVQYIWKVKLLDSNNSTCSFASKMIYVMAQSMSERRNLCDLPNSAACCCRTGPCILFSEGLGVCRDKPADVVDLLYHWDWPTILQRTDAPISDDDDLSSAILIFVAVHRWLGRLLQEDHNNPKAKEVLQKLGSCDTLLRRVLRGTIAGQMSSTPGAYMLLLEFLGIVVDFLYAFLHCLTPIPWDRDIDSLVRRARSTIMEALTTIMMNDMAVMAQNPKESSGTIDGTNSVLF
jgi:hypothetical protein